MPENRKHARRKLVLPVAFQVGDGPTIEAESQDVSLSGMFIRTDQPLPYGTTLQIFLPLPGMVERARIVATVRWSNASGMGVQLGAMGARDTHALTALLYGSG